MRSLPNSKGRDVYVIDGNRTPFLKAKGIGPFTAADLAVAAGTPLLLRQPFARDKIDEVILGCAMPGVDEANIARIVALRLQCGDKVPAYTVMRNCASGMQAIDNAAMQIALGKSDLILTGGMDAMSHAPLLYNQAMSAWFAQWGSCKKISQKLRLLTQLRPSLFSPVVALLHGLSDPLIGMDMGQTAENLAEHFQILRKDMDAFALESHLRIAKAYEENTMMEVTPIMDKKGQVYYRDDGIRPNGSLEKLATLKPVFDKKYGQVTAGNSSQVSDGACLLLLASAKAIEKYDLPILGRIVDTEWAALPPSQMGLGPVHAALPLLQRQALTLQDIDCWEINEAFAAQVLACLQAMDNEEYCQRVFGLKAPGAPSLLQVNREGGAIALGHPIGASGARIVLHVLSSLKKHKEKRGIAAICIGGGQGGAMYLERVTGVKES